MRNLLSFALALSVVSCGGEAPSSEQPDPSAYATGPLPTARTVQNEIDGAEVQPSADEPTQAVIGKGLTASDDAAQVEPTDHFAPGDPVRLAVKVSPSAAPALVRVAWYGPDDRLVREDTQQVAEPSEPVSFAAGEDIEEKPGEYRAEVWLEDQKIAEQRFSVVLE